MVSAATTSEHCYIHRSRGDTRHKEVELLLSPNVCDIAIIVSALHPCPPGMGLSMYCALFIYTVIIERVLAIYVGLMYREYLSQRCSVRIGAFSIGQGLL